MLNRRSRAAVHYIRTTKKVLVSLSVHLAQLCMLKDSPRRCGPREGRQETERADLQALQRFAQTNFEHSGKAAVPAIDGTFDSERFEGNLRLEALSRLDDSLLPAGSALASMQRIPTLFLLAPRLAAPPHTRLFSLSTSHQSKHSNSNRSRSSTVPTAKATTVPGQAGTDVGRATGGGKKAAGEGLKEVTPEAIEAEMLAGQASLQNEAQGERKNLAGTDVAQGESSGKAKDEYGACACCPVTSGYADR